MSFIELRCIGRETKKKSSKHYIAYRKIGQNWMKFDDTEVSIVKLHKMYKIYVMFYRNSTTTLPFDIHIDVNKYKSVGFPPSRSSKVKQPKTVKQVRNEDMSDPVAVKQAEAGLPETSDRDGMEGKTTTDKKSEGASSKGLPVKVAEADLPGSSAEHDMDTTKKNEKEGEATSAKLQPFVTLVDCSAVIGTITAINVSDEAFKKFAGTFSQKLTSVHFNFA